MLNGNYRTVNEADGYDIMLDVKETDKSYIFTLEKDNSKETPEGFKKMFAKSEKHVARKSNLQHTITLLDDNTGFTIDLYNGGVKYLFKEPLVGELV